MAYSGNFYHPIPGDIPDNQWKTPFALAVGLHLFVLVLSLLPASLFQHRPELPEVITINLFNAEEQQPKRHEPQQKRQPPKPAPQPEKVDPPKAVPPPPAEKPVTSIVPESPPPAVAAPAKVTSLAPRKIKIKTPPPPEEPKRKELDDKRLKALDRIQAMVNKRTEDQKLKHDLARLRESLHVTQPESSPAPPAETPSEHPVETSQTSAPSTGSTELMDTALKHYYIAVSRRIHNHWVLPEMQNWDNTLEALMVLIVRNDGTIIKSYFEKRSGNIYFDQFVEKTIKEAAPLPQFPANLNKPQLDIGLRFHPSGLF